MWTVIPLRNRISILRSLDYLTLKMMMTLRFVRNIGNCTPSDATSHPFRNPFVPLLYVKYLLLGAFEKLRKAIISFVMHVSPSVLLSAWNKSVPTKRIFMKFDIWVFFEKPSLKFKFHYNRTRITGTLYAGQYTFLSYLAQLFLEWEMFQTKVVEDIKTHILCSVTFSQKSCRLWDNVEKYGRAGQVTDENMAHAHSMLDN